MKINYLSALAAFSVLVGIQARADTGATGTDNMASIGINTGTEVVTLTTNWAIRPSLSGFHLMAQDMGLTGGAANEFYSLKGTALPIGDITGFTRYVAASGAWADHADISSKLAPSAGLSYSGLTSADPDLGYGPVRLYTIHHTAVGDQLTVIKTSSGTASAVIDEKPMSGPAGTESGYFGLTFSADDLTHGANLFYYFRKDPVTSTTRFGTLVPALAGARSELFDLGLSGHNALAYTTTSITTRFGINQMYFLRLDPVTGFTIFGTLNPVSGKASDMANLGSVYSTLSFVPGDVGFGTNKFYSVGTVNPTWQSVSFASIADRAISAGSFTVSPSASSALPITLTVVAGSVGSATISAPVGGVFTVTPTAPGLITLQASQAGSVAPAFEFNMLRQSFTATGIALPIITNSPLTAAGTVGTPFSFTITATGPAASYSASPLPAGLSLNPATGAITGTPTAVGVTSVLLGATNGVGTGNATLTITFAASAVAPIITNNVLTAAVTVGAPFSYTITASGSPSSYTASPLPAGLSLNAATGLISGFPTTAGLTTVLLGATNGNGTGNATLTVLIANGGGGGGATPIVTNNVLSGAAGTIGAPFSFTITASGSPTSYTASPLPPGLSLVAATGVITGIPTTAGTTTVLLGASNGSGTGNATLIITVAAANVVPIVTSPTSASGTAGTPFPTYVVTATGQPTSYTATGLPPGLSINPLTGAINGTPTGAGTYVVTITATNASGSSTFTLTIVIAGDANFTSRIMNFSARALSGPGDATLIMGFVVSGNGKHLLIRGVGPTLASLGISNYLADPMLTLFSATGVMATNDNWGTTMSGQPDGTLIAPTAAQVGAFALPSGSLDSALLITVNNGAHTTSMLRPNSSTGVALTEIYDTDVAAGARLINVSARMNVSGGEGTLIAGLVIGGNAAKTVLIRGVGPGLSAYAVTGVLADPQIAVFSGSTVIASNDNWEVGTSTSAQIIAAAAQVGAFPLAAGSKDASLIITLQPGAYTVQVTGVGNTTGVALVEVYDTQ